MIRGHINPHFIKLTALTICVYELLAEPALAHVKWFAPYDVAAQPKALYSILTSAFWAFLCISIILLASASYVERRPFAARFISIFDNATGAIRRHLDDMMRAGTGAFFISLWAIGGIFLTPELKTDLIWVPWIQCLIAASLLNRPTLPFGAFGIALLWVLALQQYGLFHMLDYPIFLGVSAYFAICAFPASQLFSYRYDVLRWSAAVTLMWASIEKFAYPEWSFPVLERMPFLKLGLESSQFMTLAGMAEFVMAFALICSPPIRRLSAMILFSIFAAAIIPFGKIDAIGHLVILLIFIVIIFDDKKEALIIRTTYLLPTEFFTLFAFTISYYILHAIFYGPDTFEAALKHHAGIQAYGPTAGIYLAPQSSPPQPAADMSEPQLWLKTVKSDDQQQYLLIMTQNFVFLDVPTTGKQGSTVGHAHVYLDGKKIATAMKPIVPLGRMATGQHHIHVTLQAQDHSDLIGQHGKIARSLIIDVNRSGLISTSSIKQ